MHPHNDSVVHLGMLGCIPICRKFELYNIWMTFSFCCLFEVAKRPESDYGEYCTYFFV